MMQLQQEGTYMIRPSADFSSKVSIIIIIIIIIIILYIYIPSVVKSRGLKAKLKAKETLERLEVVLRGCYYYYYYYYYYYRSSRHLLAVWLSGNGVAHISQVALH